MVPLWIRHVPFKDNLKLLILTIVWNKYKRLRGFVLISKYSKIRHCNSGEETCVRKVQISIKETISNILLSTTRTTNNTNYFFSKIETVSDCSFLIKPIPFSKQFKVFAHIYTYSNLGRVLEDKPTFETIHNLRMCSTIHRKMHFHNLQNSMNHWNYLYLRNYCKICLHIILLNTESTEYRVCKKESFCARNRKCENFAKKIVQNFAKKIIRKYCKQNNANISRNN